MEELKFQFRFEGPHILCELWITDELAIALEIDTLKYDIDHLLGLEINMWIVTRFDRSYMIEII